MKIKEMSDWLNILLQIKRQPIGIKFLLTEEKYNAFEAVNVEKAIPYCTAVSKAGNNNSLKMQGDFMGCRGGAMALGFIKPDNNTISGKRRLEMGIYGDLGISRGVSRDMIYCEHEIYGVGVKPLGVYTDEPDVVIIIGNSFVGMRIIQGYAYCFGHAKNLKISGMQAICQECTSFVYEEGKLNLSLLCSGTRKMAGWKKDELAIGIPFRQLPKIIDGIRDTVNPLERNKEKKEIERKQAETNTYLGIDIRYNKNYDDGAYVKEVKPVLDKY